MKRIMILCVVLLAVAPVIATAQYTFSQEFSTALYQGYFMDCGPDGKVWASEYGAPFTAVGNSKVRAFNPNGSLALTYDVKAPEWAESCGTAGTACFGGKTYISVDTGEGQSAGGTGQQNNCAIWNNDGTRATPAALTLKYTVTAGDVNLRLGDLDFDNAGHLFADHKVEDAFSVFDKDTGAILSGCPIKNEAHWGTGETGAWYVVRGIAVRKDGTKVYRNYGSSGSSSSGLEYWEGSITGNTASYTCVNEALADEAGNPDAIFTDVGGRLWILGQSKTVHVYDTYDNHELQEYTFPEIDIDGYSHGIALNSDSTILYIFDNWTDAGQPAADNILKYTGTPPPAYITPTPTATPSPTPREEAGARCWTVYE
jgi:sugar lactone lactonase YvrE